MAVTATLNVTFTADDGSGANQLPLILEIDSREDGLNGGSTSFRPGDTVYYLLHKAASLSIIEHSATEGSISSAGGGTRRETETLTFSDAKEASVRYPVSSIVSMSWLGTSPGTASLVDDTTITIPSPGFGLLRVVYDASYSAYSLSSVPTTIDQVLIWAKAE